MFRANAWWWLAAPVVFGPSLAASQLRIPSKVTFRYVAGQDLKPIQIRGKDGRIFELSIDGLTNGSELTLFRPGHKSSATNLLEPKSNWHGIEPFQMHCEYSDEPLYYGRHRDLPVRNYHFILHVDVARIECADSDNSANADYANVELNVELRPSP